VVAEEIPTDVSSGVEIVLQEKPTEMAQDDRDDTEEVFVIIPEEGASQLPVVETVVVEEQPWEAGPTTTEVLKGMQVELAPEEPATVPISLKDVALRKVNPLAPEAPPPPSRETEPIGDTEALAPQKSSEEEIKAIDEIADIAGELDHGDALHAGIDEPLPAASPLIEDLDPPEKAAPAGGRFRTITILTTVAALVLLGVFFYPDLSKLIWGPGKGGVVSTHGSKTGTGVSGGSRPGEGGKEAKSRFREAFRSKVLLAMKVGLRTEAGKE
jgi:hypothetical protein